MKNTILKSRKKSQGSISTWNQIDKSPMRFIKDIQTVEENGGNRYRDFVVINVIFQKMIYLF
jgi:hypothetical protein